MTRPAERAVMLCNHRGAAEQWIKEERTPSPGRGCRVTPSRRTWCYAAVPGAHAAVLAAHAPVTSRLALGIGKPFLCKSHVPNWAAARRVDGHEQQQTTSQRYQHPRPPLGNQPNVVAECPNSRFYLGLHNL